jgi:NAD(P)-dependent dehydrogenase (short-subunit alcohol dehydrogenase family)
MGNGKATAILFAKEGAKVAAVDRRMEAVKETVAMIEKEGGDAFALEADVTREPDAERIVQSTLSKYGKLDILFNNVGGAWGKLGLGVAVEDWDGVMALNLKSVLLMCKYAAPAMIEREGGAIGTMRRWPPTGTQCAYSARRRGGGADQVPRRPSPNNIRSELRCAGLHGYTDGRIDRDGGRIRQVERGPARAAR